MRNLLRLKAVCLCGLVFCGVGMATDCTPELVWVRKIWDKAPHNAFTDLIRFKKNWYCTFREADTHAAGSDVHVRSRRTESTDPSPRR